eukprot:XP_011677823.1 PREDICTED: tumor necrosis factor receptor superfamily member 16 [Strongylocentrotus purpuratus]
MLFLVFILMMVLLNCDWTSAQMRDVAMCDPGYYAEALMTNSVYPCMPCSRCPPGHYQVKSCNATQDAMCATCPTNTYSDRWTTLSACKPCTVCNRYQLHNACTSKKDTLCRTKCLAGYYFDPASHRCRRCSLCPELDGDRVYECTQQEGSGKYQCREGSVLRARRVDTNPLLNNNHTENEMTELLLPNLAKPGELSTDRMTTDLSNSEERHSPEGVDSMRKENFLMSTLPVLQTTGAISRSAVISSSAPTSTMPWATTGLRQPSSSTSKRRSVTANEVLMVIGIIAASCLVSFVTTYVTCHFLMKRGIVKSGDATVGFARGREPVKGWFAVPRGDVVMDLDATLRRTSIDMI